jgi:hypothetical protein
MAAKTDEKENKTDTQKQRKKRLLMQKKARMFQRMLKN